MFMGVHSHRGLRAGSYAEAVELHQRQSRTPTGRARRPMELRSCNGVGYPLGLTKRGRTAVIRYDDDSVAFRLYDTDVVTWHPDNSVVIDNFGTVTTPDFANNFTPGHISLRRPVETRNKCGGDKGITYYPRADGGWKDRMICSGGLVRFVEQDGAWVPDLTTCDEMRFLDLDRKLARGTAAELNLADFESWLSMAPRHLDIEHDGFDLDECVAALRCRDFRRAAETLPTITIPNGFAAYDRINPLPIAVRNRDNPVTLGSIGKLKLAYWQDMGWFDRVELKTLPLGEYDRRMARIKELAALGSIDPWEYGASS